MVFHFRSYILLISEFKEQKGIHCYSLATSLTVIGHANKITFSFST